jgi:hypothetical protein
MVEPLALVIVFMGNTGTYCVHAEGCSAATEDARRNRHRAPGTFSSVEHARRWSDQDEWEKGDGDKPVKGSAKFRVCKCAKT